MKEKIIIEKASKANNYKCDMAKPYQFADIISLLSYVGSLGMISLLLGGLMILFLTAEQPNWILSAMCALVLLILISASLFSCRKEPRRKKEFSKLLNSSTISTGTMQTIKHEKQGKKSLYRMTVKLDNDKGIVEVLTEKRYWKPNSRITVAKSGDKEFLLTKCTLIAIE